MVTGAARGIGAAIAQALAAQGHRLTLMGRRLDSLEALARELPGSGHAVVAVDVSDAASVERGFTQATVESVWRAPQREVLEAVIHLEFPGVAVERILGSIEGAELSYHYRVYYRQK